MRHFWMAFVNDGVEATGIEQPTRAAAIKDLKEAFRADCAESECGDPGFDYYIEEYWDSDTETIVGPSEYYKMTLGPRGGVKCRRTRAI